MDIQHLRHFLRIADLGSVSLAALELNMAQSALSRSIGQMEQNLCAHLFTRHGRGVALTEAGRVLYEQGQGVVRQFDACLLAVKGHASASLQGTLAIGLPPSLCRVMAVPLLRAVKAQFPALQLTLREALSHTLAEWLAHGRVDLAVLYNQQASPKLNLHPIGQEKRYLVSSLDRTPKQNRISLKALSELPLVLPSQPHATRVMLERCLAAHGLRANVAMEVDVIPTILALVKAEPVHALLPRLAVLGIADAAAFSLVPITGHPLSSQVSVASANSQPLSARFDGVRVLLQGLLRETLAQT
jgi:LysR family transcriptional regulator, nitrogen assimilation regulatory protein